MQLCPMGDGECSGGGRAAGTLAGGAGRGRPSLTLPNFHLTRSLLRQFDDEPGARSGKVDLLLRELALQTERDEATPRTAPCTFNVAGSRGLLSSRRGVDHTSGHRGGGGRAARSPQPSGDARQPGRRPCAGAGAAHATHRQRPSGPPTVCRRWRCSCNTSTATERSSTTETDRDGQGRNERHSSAAGAATFCRCRAPRSGS